MSLRKLPEITAHNLPKVCSFLPEMETIDRWNAGTMAADSKGENTISILDVIGQDFWTGEGVTSKRIAAALRSIGNSDVVVEINSPGGDYFEGVAIYNLLRDHPAKVTVKVLSLAASAASVIAMAGDEILIGKAGFIMVHNAWVVAIGNRHDLAAASKTLKPFDLAMATVYSARSGADKKTAVKWMDDETWFNGESAVSAGLADNYLPADSIKDDADRAKAFASVKSELKTEIGLARAGMSRRERRSLIGDLKGPSSAMGHDSPAVADKPISDKVLEALSALKTTLENGKTKS